MEIRIWLFSENLLFSALDGKFYFSNLLSPLGGSVTEVQRQRDDLIFVVERDSEKYLHIMTSLENKGEAADDVIALIQYSPSLNWIENKVFGHVC